MLRKLHLATAIALALAALSSPAPAQQTYFNGSPENVTPVDCSGTITNGGSPQNAIQASATVHGFTIANIDSTTGSGEPLWISFTGTASAGSVGSYPLAAPTATTYSGLTSFTSPYGFGTGHAVSIVGGTTAHKFSCTTW